MKIAFLASRSVHTIKWVNALALAGHEVHWITQDIKHESNSKVDDKVVVHQLKLSNKLGYYLNVPQLRFLLKEIKPDILNAHNASGYGTSARLAKFHPYILNAWGSDVFVMKSIFYERMVIRNLKAADGLASTSYGMAEQMRKLMNADDKEIVITPFGVDLDKYDTYMNEKYSNKDKFIIGVIKTLAPKYGIKMLIQAFQIVKQNLDLDFSKEVEFRIYGDGVQREELIIFTHELNMEDSIRFMGRIPNSEVPFALSQMDLFCLGSESESESFGVAAVEAMAMKKPVVATNVTGFREVILDGESGVLVSKKNPEAMARAILKLIYDEKERTRMGENARLRVEANYDLKRNTHTMLEMYSNIAQRSISNKMGDRGAL